MKVHQRPHALSFPFFDNMCPHWVSCVLDPEQVSFRVVTEARGTHAGPLRLGTFRRKSRADVCACAVCAHTGRWFPRQPDQEACEWAALLRHGPLRNKEAGPEKSISHIWQLGTIWNHGPETVYGQTIYTDLKQTNKTHTKNPNICKLWKFPTDICRNLEKMQVSVY